MYNVSRENFAFVIEKKANNQEEIYHLPIEEALSMFSDKLNKLKELIK